MIRPKKVYDVSSFPTFPTFLLQLSHFILKTIVKYTETIIKQVAQRATIAHLSPMCQGKSHFKKHINESWKPEAPNQTHPSFYACPGYQQL